MLEGSDLRDYLKKRPLFLCSLIGACICVMGYYSKTAVFFAGICFIIICFVLIYNSVQAPYVVVMILLVLLSVRLLKTYEKIESAQKVCGTELKGRFIVCESPEKNDGYYTSVLESAGCDEIENGTRIFVFSNESGFECGDALSAVVYADSIDERYKLSNYSEKIYLNGNIEEITDVEKDADPVLSVFEDIRGYIRKTLFSGMKYDEAATLSAVVFGDRSYIDDEFYELIKRAGVSHVMVVSGMHLAIIVSLVTRISGKLFYSSGVKAVLIFITVLFMTALCGFTKSIIRAGVCYIIYAVSILTRRDNDSVNTLGGAVTVILIAEPMTVFSISFQLSVLSTLGIVAAAVPSVRYITERRFLGGRCDGLLGAAAVTSFAMLFTLPVTSYVFGCVSSVSVVTNILISFAVTLALGLAAAGLVIYPFIPVIGKCLLNAAGIAAAYINLVIREFGSLPFAVIKLGRFAFVCSLALLFSVIWALFACKKRTDMLKLKAVNRKIVKEGGGKLRWR